MWHIWWRGSREVQSEESPLNCRKRSERGGTTTYQRSVAVQCSFSNMELMSWCHVAILILEHECLPFTFWPTSSTRLPSVPAIGYSAWGFPCLHSFAACLGCNLRRSGAFKDLVLKADWWTQILRFFSKSVASGLTCPLSNLKECKLYNYLLFVSCIESDHGVVVAGSLIIQEK